MEKFKEITDFKNKKVLIMGLGINGGGVGSAEFFATIGSKVTVTDLKTEKELKKSIKKLEKFPQIKYVLGKHKEEDFKNNDLIIKNPAVPQNSPFLKIAKKHKIPIHTEASLYFLLTPSYTIGVTGTKGKSTTSNFIYRILKKKYSARLIGNIGVSLLKSLLTLKAKDIVVAELSSWQTESLIFAKKSPQIAIITNIKKDHLNTYKSFFDYKKAKFLIAKWQNKEDELLLNISLKKDYQKFARLLKIKSRVSFYSYKKSFERKLRKFGFNFYGKGMVENAICAYKIGKIFGLKDDVIFKTLSKIKPLFGRLQLIKIKNGVKWINDTCSTNPFSTKISLSSFKNKVILISGGTDKELEFHELAKVIRKKVKKLILIPGSATEKLKKELKKLNYKFEEVKNLKEAILVAKNYARENDIVLFSPASASFELFKNEFHRGRQFVALVRKLV